MRRILLTLALVASGCAGLGHPTEADASRAALLWPGTTLASLERGRARYAARCAGCHTLHLPTEKQPGEWPAILDEMQREAKLLPAERELVERYLLVMSARDPSKRADR